jgi:hypothetical protein
MQSNQRFRFWGATAVVATAYATLVACASGGAPAMPTAGGGAGSNVGSGAPKGPTPMSFFLTSQGSGQGANLGGLAGADAHCQRLATAAGAGARNWRAYLSATSVGSIPAINARDRIGAGPWSNAQGVVIAMNVDALHGINNLNKQTALTERGTTVRGRGDTPNEHDILTGSNADGRAVPGPQDTTCGNWTKGGAEGSATVGHHDRIGIDESAPMKSWNASHGSRGCSQDALKATGGAGLFYCFATN